MSELLQNCSTDKSTDVVRQYGNGPPQSGSLSQANDRNHFASTRSQTILNWKSHCLLLGQAWDFALFRSHQGWKFSISTYAIVSGDSPVARCANTGDIAGLQRLFSEGKATPFTICYESEFQGTPMRFVRIPQKKTLLEVCITIVIQ